MSHDVTHRCAWCPLRVRDLDATARNLAIEVEAVVADPGRGVSRLARKLAEFQQSQAKVAPIRDAHFAAIDSMNDAERIAHDAATEGFRADFGPLSITRVKATLPEGEAPFSGDLAWMAAGSVIEAAVALEALYGPECDNGYFWDAVGNLCEKVRAYTRAATTPVEGD